MDYTTTSTYLAATKSSSNWKAIKVLSGIIVLSIFGFIGTSKLSDAATRKKLYTFLGIALSVGVIGLTIAGVIRVAAAPFIASQDAINSVLGEKNGDRVTDMINNGAAILGSTLIHAEQGTLHQLPNDVGKFMSDSAAIINN